MTAIIIEGFEGIAPKLDPRRLKETMAQTAKNCLLESSSLEPFPGPVTTGVSVGIGTQSIYPTDTGWIVSDTYQSYAKVHIADDTLKRIVYTDHENAGANASYPRVRELNTPAATYRLGIPIPAQSPTIGVVVDPVETDGFDTETITYVATYVDGYGSEGPPSDAAGLVDHKIDTDVAVTLPPALTGAYNLTNALIRLYRSNTGSDATGFQYVAEYPMSAGGTPIVDSVVNGNLQEVLPSFSWIRPPDDDTSIYPNGAMEQVVSMANGILAGFSHKTLCFTDPFLYHAWPSQYRITIEDEIVGIVAISSGLVVVTTRKPYLVAGVHPSSLALMELDVNQSCESKRSIVDMGEYAMYASPDGLVMVAGTEAELITDSLFSRQDWQTTWAPATIEAYYWEGKYVAFNSASSNGFIFDLQEGGSAFIVLDEYYQAGHFDAEDDTLYVMNTAGLISRFGRDFAAPTPYVWKSKIFQTGRPLNFSVGRIEAWGDLSVANVTVKVWADGDLKVTAVISDPANPIFRLPGGYREREWEVEISGANPVTRIVLAESMQELV